MNFAAAAATLLIERLTGYPKPLYRTTGHPVEWMGRLVTLLDNALNDPEKAAAEVRLRGVLCLLILLTVALSVSLVLHLLARALPAGWLAEALLAVPLLAQHSLREHVSDVVRALDNSIGQARTAVSMIVGRDPASLDESGISRAALESLAENTSDGIVAPALWLAIGGLPGIVLYKAINTADSMIGHRSPRYLKFGWAAARLDDLVNLPASRLTGILFAAAAWTGSRRTRAALDAMWRDAPNHVSPNAGWPEAALAGALGIQLGGPRSYDGRTVDLAAMGDGRSELDRDDIRRGLRLYDRAMTLLAGLAIGLALAF
jgi:adenosylcobinamide-phosphate synthase